MARQQPAYDCFPAEAAPDLVAVRAERGFDGAAAAKVGVYAHADTHTIVRAGAVAIS